jgi:hypothetical protein
MIRVLCLFLLMTGCVKTPEVLSPDALLAAGQARKIPFAMRGKFSAKLTVRGESFPSLPGAMILHQPDRFRIEMNAPIGGPVFTLVSNGSGVAMHLHRDKVTILEPEAQVFLSSFMGEGTGLKSLTSVLLGGVPLQDERPVRTETDESGTRFVYAGPQGSELKIILHPGGELARMESLDSSGVLLFSMEHESLVQVEGKGMPKVSVIEIPSQEIHLRLKFSGWSELAKIPEAFGLGVPAGIEVLDGKTALERIGGY